jgi:hypothetical protein
MLAGLIALVVSLCVFAGGIAGLLANRFLPEHHLTKETTDTVRLGAGMLSASSPRSSSGCWWRPPGTPWTPPTGSSAACRPT